MLTRTGYLVDAGPIQEIKKELTVRPIVNGDFGFPPPPFKVYKPAKNGICVPRFYGTSKLGEPSHDRRPEPVKTRSAFTGKLAPQTNPAPQRSPAPDPELKSLLHCLLRKTAQYQAETGLNLDGNQPKRHPK